MKGPVPDVSFWTAILVIGVFSFISPQAGLGAAVGVIIYYLHLILKGGEQE